MAEFTPTQVRAALIRCYMRVDFYTFVKEVLRAVPNENDVWQTEKFGIFQAAALQLARISAEHTERIVELYSD